MPRQTYAVTFPDGHVQHFDGPTGMSDADLIQRAKQERGVAGGDIATSFSGGATRHLLEDEPETVNALLGGLATATGAGAPLVAGIPAATSGLRHLSQFLATGKTDAPTLEGAIGDVVEGGVMGYGGSALAAGARKVGALKAAAGSVVPAGLKRLLTGVSPKALAMDVATSKPVLGAVERLGEGLTPGGVRSAFGSVARGMTPGVEDVAEPAAAGGFRGLEAAARRKAAAEANPGYSKFLGDMQAGRPTGDAALEATGWPGAAPVASGGPEYPSWLRTLGDEATANRPAGVAGLEATGTGTEAAGHLAGRNYPSWLRSMGDEATAAQPAGVSGLEATATGAPGAAPTSGPTWDAFASLKRAAAVPEAAPGTPPAPAYPTWGSMGALKRAGTATGAAPEATIAGDVTTGARTAGAAAEDVTPAALRRAPAPEPIPEFELVDDAIGPNASGESAASAEALSRQSSMKGAGDQYVVIDRAGRSRPLIGPEAVDYVPRPGETFGIDGPRGFRKLADNGGAAPRGRTATQLEEFSPEARAARAATRTAKAAAFDSPEQAAALEELLGTDAFQAIQRQFNKP